MEFITPSNIKYIQSQEKHRMESLEKFKAIIY